MIREFEWYHGAAIREIIVGYGSSLTIEAYDTIGRANTFKINDCIGIHIKHSSKRIPPWQFTFSDDILVEIEQLALSCRSVWIILVCGQDGAVTLALSEFWSANPRDAETTRFIRVDRDRNSMYRVNGTGGKLPRPKRRGLEYILQELRG
jgi:hypothetical protein